MPYTSEPEGCKLVAVLDGTGESASWTLCVETAEGDTVAYLAWPEAWPETVTLSKLMASGFKCIVA